MSYRDTTDTVQEYVRALEDRIRSLELSNRVSARGWVIGENSAGDLVFTHQDGRMVTIGKIGSNTTI